MNIYIRSLFLSVGLSLLCTVASAQMTTLTPVCSGNATADTAAITALKTIIVNSGVDGTIALPRKSSTQRCKVNSLSLPTSVTLDNTHGSGIYTVTGQVLTVLGPIHNPRGKQMFFNATSGGGSVSLAGNTNLAEVYVEWWGGKANGSTDSTSAFNAAIAALTNNQPGVNGATVHLLIGDYRITGLTITDQQVHIIGSGSPGVLGSAITCTTTISSVTNAPILKYARSTEVYSERARLENVCILGSVTAGTNQVGVWVDNNGILMNNVGIEKTGSHGLLISHSNASYYGNIEIGATKGDAMRLNTKVSDSAGAAVQSNLFGRISMLGDVQGDGLRIMHGRGNHFPLIDCENLVGSGGVNGRCLNIYYPGDGDLEPQNNIFDAVWNENSALGDSINQGNGAYNNHVVYTHYSSPTLDITGSNTYREAEDIGIPGTVRGQYLLLGASETTLYRLIAKPGAATVALTAGPGITGTYFYSITFETAVGETDGGTVSATVTPANQTVHLTNIPIGATGTTKRHIYRTTNGGNATTLAEVDALADNTTTTYDDTTPDAALGNAIPLFNGSGSRMQLDGDGNMAQFGNSSQTSLVGPQRSNKRWPNYGFQARPGYGMNMMNSDRVSLIGGEREGLSVDSTGTANARVAFKIGSGASITKYLSGTASVDFDAWAGFDCQTKTVTVTGAVDGDDVIIGIPNALASVTDIMWSYWVSGADTVTLRGCKASTGASANPSAATVRASVVQH